MGASRLSLRANDLEGDGTFSKSFARFARFAVPQSNNPAPPPALMDQGLKEASGSTTKPNPNARLHLSLIPAELEAPAGSAAPMEVFLLGGARLSITSARQAPLAAANSHQALKQKQTTRAA